MGLILGDLSYREDVTRAGPRSVSGPALDEHMASHWEKFAEINDGQTREFAGFKDLTGLMMRRSS